jgi:SMODS-associating 2TM, beta-strand rich effector domain
MGQLVTMAHPYSTDAPERQYIPFFVAAAAIGAAFLASHVFDTYQIRLPWWVSPPIDTMAFYGLFYWLFDRFVWKWGWIHRLQITRIPDLSGVWQGQVNPTETGVSTGFDTKTAIIISIQQTGRPCWSLVKPNYQNRVVFPAA